MAVKSDWKEVIPYSIAASEPPGDLLGIGQRGMFPSGLLPGSVLFYSSNKAHNPSVSHLLCVETRADNLLCDKPGAHQSRRFLESSEPS